MQTFNCGQAADAAIRHRGLDANLYQLENSGIAVRQGCLLACHTSMQFAAHGGVRMTVIPFNRIERASARRVSSPLISIQELSKELDVPVSTLRGRQFKYKIADICAGIPLLLDHEIACFTARENAWWTSRNRSTLHLRGGCDLQEVQRRNGRPNLAAGAPRSLLNVQVRQVQLRKRNLLHELCLVVRV
jgi:hypothetical protein